VSLAISQDLKTSENVGGGINKCDSFMLCDKIFQNLKDLSISMNKLSPNEQCTVIHG
jgi:hypothetical protein